MSMKNFIRLRGEFVNEKRTEKVLGSLAKENIVRVFFAALILTVYECVIMSVYCVKQNYFLGELPKFLPVAAYLVIGLTFAGLSFLIIRKKMKKMYESFSMVFWVAQIILCSLMTFFATSRVMRMTQIIILFIVVALVPLLSAVKYAVLAVLSAVTVFIHAAIDTIDIDGLVYTGVVIFLCTIISRMAYKKEYREMLDRTEMSNVKNQAETDPMTELLNRRGLERRIGSIWSVCMRQNTKVAVIMVDIDNFKKYNDTFGHSAGDECIKSIGKVIKKHTRRDTDYSARVGGEEFLIFLTGLEAQDAIKWAESCKNDVEALKIKHAEDNFLPYVTISMGICHASPFEEKKEFWELRNEADRSLYQAKENGKACIYLQDKCYAKTLPDSNRKQYIKEKLFRSI